MTYSLTCIARSQKQSGQFQILLHSGMHGFRAMLYQAMHWAWRFDRSGSSLRRDTSVRSVLVADTQGGDVSAPVRIMMHSWIRWPRPRGVDLIQSSSLFAIVFASSFLRKSLSASRRERML